MWEMLKIAFPLVLAASAHAVNLLADRIMLDHYSSAAVAGSMAAGLTSFTLSCFFLGIIGYTGTFVAQYYGAGAYDRVGLSVPSSIHVFCPLTSVYPVGPLRSRVFVIVMQSIVVV